MSNVIVFKSNTTLILYSDKAVADKTRLNILEDVVINGMQIVKVSCDIDYTGYIHLPRNVSFKDHEEIMTLPGVYFIQESKGLVPVVNLTNKRVSLVKGIPELACCPCTLIFCHYIHLIKSR